MLTSFPKAKRIRKTMKLQIVPILILIIGSGLASAQKNVPLAQSSLGMKQAQVATESPAKTSDAELSQSGSNRISSRKEIVVSGTLRTFLLYVPKTYRPGRSALLIALHGRGSGGPAAAMEAYTRLDEKAEEAGFAVAYLDGLADATGAVNWNYFYRSIFCEWSRRCRFCA